MASKHLVKLTNVMARDLHLWLIENNVGDESDSEEGENVQPYYEDHWTELPVDDDDESVNNDEEPEWILDDDIAQIR